jgi:hypothetical protein
MYMILLSFAVVQYRTVSLRIMIACFCVCVSASCRPVQLRSKHDKNLFLQLGATCSVMNVWILTAISFFYLFFFVLYLFLRLCFLSFRSWYGAGELLSARLLAGRIHVSRNLCYQPRRIWLLAIRLPSLKC